MTIDLNAAQTFAEATATDAGRILTEMFTGPLTETTKNGPADIVTEADRRAEDAIVKAITTRYPDHHIVGEEGGGMGAPRADAAYHWYVDPLDGTTNYANRIPHFATSIALTDRDMTPLVGVVFHPIAEEMYSAVRGGGAALNGQQMRVSGAESLSVCVLASGFPHQRQGGGEENVAPWGRFVSRSRGLRRMGSAALDLCYVAAGRFDGYWELSLNPWDFMGGLLCVLEAGGAATDLHGETASADLYERGRIVASNGHIHAQMLDVLNGG